MTTAAFKLRSYWRHVLMWVQYLRRQTAFRPAYVSVERTLWQSRQRSLQSPSAPGPIGMAKMEWNISIYASRSTLLTGATGESSGCCIEHRIFACIRSPFGCIFPIAPVVGGRTLTQKRYLVHISRWHPLGGCFHTGWKFNLERNNNLFKIILHDFLSRRISVIYVA